MSQNVCMWMVASGESVVALPCFFSQLEAQKFASHRGGGVIRVEMDREKLETYSFNNSLDDYSYILLSLQDVVVTSKRMKQARILGVADDRPNKRSRRSPSWRTASRSPVTPTGNLKLDDIYGFLQDIFKPKV